MIIYHRTTAAAALAIQEHGFMDGAECYGTSREKAGVVFTDRIADTGNGEALLTIDLVSEDIDSLRRFEWQGPDHRTAGNAWLIPAEFANARAVIVSVDVPDLLRR